MRIESGVKIGFNDVMIKPKKSMVISRSEVKLEREFHFLHSNYTWKGVPVIASNMDTVGTFEAARELSKYNMLTILHKYYTIKQIIAFFRESPDFLDFVSISTGIIESDIVKLYKILSEFDGIKFVCVDIANGYLTSFYDRIKKIRDSYPEKIIVAGNVVTPEAVEDVLKSGADIVKVGVGSGSVCTTRLKTGVGYPQLSAVSECAEAAQTNNGLIISDGGCTVPGDIAKAFGAGADFVMLGGMLAGHNESGGVTVDTNGTKYK
jgi:GMP reductase